MGNQPIKVLIVDDHVMVRKGIKALLSEYEDITVIGEAADGLKAIDMVEALETGCRLDRPGNACNGRH